MRKHLVETIDLLAVLDDRPLNECYDFGILSLIQKKIISKEQVYTCTFKTKIVKDNVELWDERKIRVGARLAISVVINGIDGGKDGMWKGAIRFYRDDILEDLGDFNILEAKCFISCMVNLKRRY